jgi:hypothetical protein
LTLSGEFPEQATLVERRAELRRQAEAQRDDLKARKLGPWAPSKIVVTPPQEPPRRILTMTGTGGR